MSFRKAHQTGGKSVEYNSGSSSSEKTKSCHATVQYHFEPPKALWNTEPVGFEDKRNKISF